MKKTYIRPEATSVRLMTETALMSVSYGANTIQEDDWSNQREWSNTSNSAPWNSMDNEEE